MATYTAAEAASTYPLRHALGNGLAHVFSHIAITATLAPADTIQMCKVPSGHTIVGGWIRINDADTNATETLDFDVGDGTTADALLNGGVLTGDAVTGYLPGGGTLMPFNGDLTATRGLILTSDTTITITVNAAAATQAATVYIQVYVEYEKTPSYLTY